MSLEDLNYEFDIREYPFCCDIIIDNKKQTLYINRRSRSHLDIYLEGGNTIPLIKMSLYESIKNYLKNEFTILPIVLNPNYMAFT